MAALLNHPPPTFTGAALEARLVISAEDDDLIEQLLMAWVVSQPSVRLAIVHLIGDVVFQAGVPDSPTPQILVRAAIDLCLRDKWNHDPPWLRQILEPIRLQGKIPRILDSIARPPVVTLDPVSDIVLRDGSIFVNRLGFRRSIRLLAASDSPKRIMVVEGARKSGKSYSKELLGHACVALGDGRLLTRYVPIIDGAERSTRPVDLARDIVSGFARPMQDIPTQTTTLARYLYELGRWVVHEALLTPYDWWLVIDGLGREGVRDDTKQLVGNIATEIASAGLESRRLRLVLIDFDRTTLEIPPGGLLPEATSALSEGDITDFVSTLLTQKQKTADVAAVVALLLQGLPTDLERSKELNRRLVAYVQTLEEVA